MSTDVVDATAVEEPPEPGMAVAILDGPGQGIIRAERPEDILGKATQIANALKGLIDSQGLAVHVGGRKKHVEVGAWQACGTMLGALGGQALHAETVWTRPVIGDDGIAPRRTQYTATVTRYPKGKGPDKPVNVTTYEVDGFDWEACVEVRTASGAVVGKAEAMVSRSEETWNTRDDYALRSMAETRAESRAYRRAIGWIVNLAGYNATPAEEMGHTPGADTGPERPFGDKLDSSKVPAVVAAIVSLLSVDDAKAREVAGTIGALAGGYMPAIVGDALIAIAPAAARAAGEQAPAPAAPPPAPAQAPAAGPDEQVSASGVDRALVALLNTDDEHYAARRKADARMVALGAPARQRLQNLQAGGFDELIARLDTAVTGALDKVLALDDSLARLRAVVATGLRAMSHEPHEILAALRKAQTEAALEGLVSELQAAMPSTPENANAGSTA